MTGAGELTLRGLARRPVVQDATLAALLITACVLINRPDGVVRMTPPDPFGFGYAGKIAIWWVATAAAAVGVALRRRWPLPMLIVCTLAVAVHLIQPVLPMIADLSVLVLLYTVASRHDRAVSGAALVGLLLLSAVWSMFYVLNGHAIPGIPTLEVRIGQRIGPSGPDGSDHPGGRTTSGSWSGLFVFGSALLATRAIGSSTRNRRAYLDQLHGRARDLERERDQQAALAVAAERGRISREMHDVVAHGLSLIVIQAQGGAASLDKRPTETRAALEAIVTTGRDTLADMRRTLTALGEVDDPWHPQPGLAQLSALLTQVRLAGVPVRLRVSGSPVALPSAVDLSAYRIVQEALTNTMKHANAGANADVLLAYRDAEVIIEVSDDGRDAVKGDGSGNGLRGMHERVKLLGGRLTAEPRPRTGFVVRATLPIDGHGR